MAVAMWVVGGAVLILAYTYLGYPLFMIGWARWRARPVRRASVLPAVTLFIAARNEAEALPARLENACQLDYPELRIVVVSDGSSDETEQIASEWPDPRVSIVVLEKPVGKTAATQVATQTVRGSEILAFTDATARWDPSTLRTLVRSFADRTVGAVSGRVVYEYPKTGVAAGFRRYQRLVVPARLAESASGSVTSVSGSICAIRAGVFCRVDPELSYDLVHPLEAARQGFRSVLDADAISVESARSRSSREFRSRVRLALSAYAFIGHLSRCRGVPWGFWWRVVSHKVLRWLSPSVLVLMTLAGFTLAWLEASVLLVLFGLTALAGASPGRAGRFFGPFLFVAVVMAAYLVGLVSFFRGSRIVGWEPSSQR